MGYLLGSPELRRHIHNVVQVRDVPEPERSHRLADLTAIDRARDHLEGVRGAR